MNGNMAASFSGGLVVVEDSDDDFEALTRTFAVIGFTAAIIRMSTAEECLQSLARLAAAPDPLPNLPTLIVLDLNLPGMDGRELLCALKVHPILRVIPVAICTTSVSRRDVEYCFFHHANAYHKKPMNLGELEAQVKTLAAYWFAHVVLPVGKSAAW